MMSVFQAFLSRKNCGSFGRAAGKSIENLRRPAVAAKSMQGSS